MRTRNASASTLGLLIGSFLSILCLPVTVLAHCDTLGGPVVAAAKAALQKGDVTPVLKWVMPEHEKEIREAFAKTLEVRKLGAAVQDLADRYFFETLVRVHREGEGEPYTGIKASGTDPGSGIAAADRALDNNSPDDLIRSMTAKMTTEIQERYVRTVETRKRADESVQAGREYVAAYVEFIHYVERIQESMTKSTSHGPRGGEVESVHPH